MNKIKCTNGHFYDGDRFAQCPVCGGGPAGAAPVMPPMGGMVDTMGKTETIGGPSIDAMGKTETIGGPSIDAMGKTETIGGPSIDSMGKTETIGGPSIDSMSKTEMVGEGEGFGFGGYDQGMPSMPPMGGAPMAGYGYAPPAPPAPPMPGPGTMPGSGGIDEIAPTEMAPGGESWEQDHGGWEAQGQWGQQPQDPWAAQGQWGGGQPQIDDVGKTQMGPQEDGFDLKGWDQGQQQQDWGQQGQQQWAPAQDEGWSLRGRDEYGAPAEGYQAPRQGWEQAPAPAGGPDLSAWGFQPPEGAQPAPEGWGAPAQEGFSALDAAIQATGSVGTEAPAPAPVQAGGIEDIPKTTSFYDFDDEEPPVAWLIGIKGPYLGKALECKTGKNKIGRNPDMDINLADDTSVTRALHATVLYDPAGRKFYLQPGDSDGLTYRNGELVMTPAELAAYDKITLGKAEFVFLPLCGEQFTWDTYMTEE